MSNCKERFLEDIAEISLHPVDGCKFPIPFAVGGIASMLNCTLSTPVLRIGIADDTVQAEDGSLVAKCTTQPIASGFLCLFEISANIEDESDNIHTLYNNIYNKDHYVCIRTRDDKHYLCYTLPNTFQFLSPTTIQGGKQRQVSINTKANSEFIEITLK